MLASPFNPAARLWAARIAEGCAARARPQMSVAARTVLVDRLAGWLDAVVPSAPIGDWPDASNADFT